MMVKRIRGLVGSRVYLPYTFTKLGSHQSAGSLLTTSQKEICLFCLPVSRTVTDILSGHQRFRRVRAVMTEHLMIARRNRECSRHGIASRALMARLTSTCSN